MGAANLASGSGCSSVVPGQANHAGWGAAELIFPSVEHFRPKYTTSHHIFSSRNPLWLAHWQNANQLPFWAFYGFSMAFFTSTWPQAPGVLAGAPHLLHLPLPAAPSVPLHTLAPQHAGRLAR